MFSKKKLVAIALLMTAFIVPSTATALPPTHVTLATWNVAPYNWLPAATPWNPVQLLGPYTINGVTTDDAKFGILEGAVNCSPPYNVGAACFTFPAINPSTGTPVSVFDCQITQVGGPWTTFGLQPAIHLAQDTDGNGILDNTWLGGTDVSMSISFAYGSPSGAYPATWPAGAAGGQAFTGVGGAFDPNLPVYVILSHVGWPVSPQSALLSASVACVYY